LDRYVQHLPGDFVLHPGQSDPVRMLANRLGEQVCKDDLAKVIDHDWIRVGGRIAGRDDLDITDRVTAHREEHREFVVGGRANNTAKRRQPPALWQ
jgi:hypothetical protein